VVDSEGKNKCWLWAERRGLGFVGAWAGRKKAILPIRLRSGLRLRLHSGPFDFAQGRVEAPLARLFMAELETRPFRSFEVEPRDGRGRFAPRIPAHRMKPR